MISGGSNNEPAWKHGVLSVDVFYHILFWVHREDGSLWPTRKKNIQWRGMEKCRYRDKITFKVGSRRNIAISKRKGKNFPGEKTLYRSFLYLLSGKSGCTNITWKERLDGKDLLRYHRGDVTGPMPVAFIISFKGKKKARWKVPIDSRT